MLKQITCNNNNYESKLLSFINKRGIENKKRSEIKKNKTYFSGKVYKEIWNLFR